VPVVNNYTALLSGSYWGGIEVVHTPIIVTYSFTTAATYPDYPVDGFTAATEATFQEFSAAEKTQARTALGEWAAAGSIVFLEVAPGHGDINFQLVDFDTTSYVGYAGIGFYPFGEWNSLSYPYFTDGLNVSGDIFMNSDFETGSGAGEQVNYGTLLHEIGHAIGLKHPTEVVTNFAANPDVVHDQVLSSDDPNRTIMASVGGANEHLTALDMQAAAFIYGAAGDGGVFQADASGNTFILSSWSWDADTETLTMTGKNSNDSIRGTPVNDIITGLNGNDLLFGLNGNDMLDGGAGDDTLYGGAGIDTMMGKTGNDTYFVDDPGDIIKEALAWGTADWVYVFSTYILANNVEGMQLFGDGLTGTGNNIANTIYGDGAFANTLYGLGGDDYIVGGGGGDTIRGGNNNDQIFGQGGADNITGDAGSDFLSGDAGNDKVNGGDGDDDIYGGLGRDTLTGGAGADYFVFDTAAAADNADKITDLDIAADFTVFMQSVYTELDIGPGSTLAASNFHTGTAATTADHHIIYDSAAGKLFYDTDGVGGTAHQLVTTLTTGLALTNQDFLVF
jgi:Ca2+-binding RTX toxin-like protein